MDNTNELTRNVPFTDLQLSATLPQEMAASQDRLIEWVGRKLEILKKEGDDMHEAYLHARKAGWKYDTLLRAYNKSFKETIYYEKIKAALEQGYCIVPNFPMQAFVIRTTGKLNGFWKTGWHNTDHRQPAKELAAGDGEYQNPFPIVKNWKTQENGETILKHYADEWDDINFPVQMAKPQIMEATSRAMALKIFDEIGIFPPTVKEDPVILGRIIRKRGYNTRTVSFMIAWHLNTKVL